MENFPIRIIVLAVLPFLPAVVSGECTCDPDDGDIDKALSRKYKRAALASILVAGSAGGFLPLAGKRFPALRPESSFFFIVKAFAAGVFLSTGFIHLLPDAFERLTSSCLPEHPWGDFPFAGFVAMLAAIGTLMADTYATSYNARRLNLKAAAGENEAYYQEGAVPMNGHSADTQLLRHRVISQVLELGIIVHSVIIAIALGASQSPKTIRPLIAAVTFHKFFEGIGLGRCMIQAMFTTRSVSLMTLYFAITTPSGIIIGITITKAYKETSSTILMIQGIFNSASAGILIYMALVDLLSADFMSPKLQSNGKLQLAANVSLLIGAACISLIAKWA